jgi:hypothetical protein
MRKTDETCPQCGAPLYLRVIALDRGLRVTNLECHVAGCEWHDEPTIEGDDQ